MENEVNGRSQRMIIVVHSSLVIIVILRRSSPEIGLISIQPYRTTIRRASRKEHRGMLPLPTDIRLPFARE